MAQQKNRRAARTPPCATSLGALHEVRVCGSVAPNDGSAAERCGMGTTTSPKAKKLPAELLRVNAQTPEADVLRYAAHFLARGCVVGIPTDTFYGLAADLFNLAAVDELYRVKGRPETRALPILVNSLEQALMLLRDREEEPDGVARAPRNFMRLTEAFWPGGLTLVMDASDSVPLKVTADT